MYRIIPATLICLLSLIALGCQPEPNEMTADDPETVLRAYQAFYDQNMFDEARALATAAEQERLTELESIIRSESQDSTILQTAFQSIKCTVQGDTAICNCTLRDQYEQYQASFQLIRQEDRWLVDAPHEEQLQIDQEIDRIIDSILHNSSESF